MTMVMYADFTASHRSLTLHNVISQARANRGAPSSRSTNVNATFLMDRTELNMLQRRIQDFREGSANPKGRGCQFITLPNFVENCMKMK